MATRHRRGKTSRNEGGTSKRKIVAAALVAPLLVAADLSTEEAARRFGAREAMSGMEVSPGGDQVLFLGPSGTRGTGVFVVPLATLSPRRVPGSSGNPETLEDCSFVGDARLTCRVSVYSQEAGVGFIRSRLIALGADGSGVTVLHAGGDSAPGNYFLFDRAKKSLGDLGPVRPELEGVALASVKPITYPAADGTRNPGYLTLPPGRAIRAPVLMFHGTRDLNVDVSHARRMHARLREAGKASDYVEFDKLEHSLVDSAARATMLARMAAFLDKHVR